MTQIDAKLSKYALILSLAIYLGFIIDILTIKLGTWSFSDFNPSITLRENSIFVGFSVRSEETFTGNVLVTTLGPSVIGYLTLILLPLFGSPFVVRLLYISSEKDQKFKTFYYSVILLAFALFDAFMIVLMQIRVQRSANGVGLSDVLTTQLFVLLMFLTLFQIGIIFIIAQIANKQSIGYISLTLRYILILLLFFPYLYILASIANADVHVR